MRQLLNAGIIMILLFPFASCSSTGQSNPDESYRIDFYSGGGYTGAETGLTLFSNGKVYFWKKLINAARVANDSLQLTNDQIIKLNNLIRDPGVFSYTHKYSGNYTTHLAIIRDIQLNQISFNVSDLPGDMPDPIKNLISEIQNIFKSKGA